MRGASPVSPTYAPTLTPTPLASVTATAAISPAATQRQLRVFHTLWDNVNRYYVYPDFNGVDWAAVRTTTDQRIQAGISDDAFYDLMRDVVDGLKDNHSSFLSPQDAQREEEEFRGDGQYVGVGIISEVNAAKRYAYVLQVLPGSPAQQAGIRAHDHILMIGGQPSVDRDSVNQMALLRGPEGSTVTVTVRTPGAEPRPLVLTRTNLSTSSPVEYHLLRGRKRIGYIQIPTFFEQDVGAQVRAALAALMQSAGVGGRLDGLIVDIRINGGGEYQVLMQTLGFFTQGRVGELVDRTGVVAPLVVNARRIGNSQNAPIVILTGRSTESYAEVFAGAMRARGRAKLVGETTAGNIETLRAHRFEDGSVAWLAEETFHLSDGSNWEGKGLQPDVVVNRAWDEYTADNDPVIAAAVKLLSAGR
jgi:C-terminal peptidase prc